MQYMGIVWGFDLMLLYNAALVDAANTQSSDQSSLLSSIQQQQDLDQQIQQQQVDQQAQQNQLDMQQQYQQQLIQPSTQQGHSPQPTIIHFSHLIEHFDHGVVCHPGKASGTLKFVLWTSYMYQSYQAG